MEGEFNAGFLQVCEAVDGTIKSFHYSVSERRNSRYFFVSRPRAARLMEKWGLAGIFQRPVDLGRMNLNRFRQVRLRGENIATAIAPVDAAGDPAFRTAGVDIREKTQR